MRRQDHRCEDRVHGPSPRSSDRGSIAASEERRPEGRPNASSPRSSDRGSIAAPMHGLRVTVSTRVTAVLGPRLHCGGAVPLPWSSCRSCHRGPRTAAPLRRGPPRPLACRGGVTAVLGPRLHCGRRYTPNITHTAWSHRGPRTAAPLRPPVRERGAGHVGARHRGPRTAAPLRPRVGGVHRLRRPPVTAVLGPRLHCGLAGVAQLRLGLRVTAVLGPRLHCGLHTPGHGCRCPQPSPRSSDRGSIAATPTSASSPLKAGVTAVLGPRLHCGEDHPDVKGERERLSPRSSDRGSIAASAGHSRRHRERCHRGPRTAAPLRPRLRGALAQGFRWSPRSSDRGSIAA